MRATSAWRDTEAMSSRRDERDSITGVDGCRVGWVVASDDGTDVRVTVETSIAPVLQRFQVIGVDMPIGLPATWDRAADRLARRFLSPRSATVFPTPPRQLIDARSYAEANARSKEFFGKGLTKQTYNLFAKLREVDALITAADVERVIEVHPECALRAMTGSALPSKHTASGRVLRREALRPIFGDVVDTRVAGAAADDVLDALAVLWSVRRYVGGEHIVFGDGRRDERGLVMQIIC
jgi:predicted RNase H-like nuclease